MTHPKFSVTTLNKKTKAELILIARGLGAADKGLKCEIIAAILEAQAAIEPKPQYQPTQYPNGVEVTDFDQLRQKTTPLGAVRYEVTQYGEFVGSIWIGENCNYYCQLSDNVGSATLEDAIALLTAPSESDAEFIDFMLEPVKGITDAGEQDRRDDESLSDIVGLELLNISEQFDRYEVFDMFAYPIGIVFETADGWRTHNSSETHLNEFAAALSLASDREVELARAEWEQRNLTLMPSYF